MRGILTLLFVVCQIHAQSPLVIESIEVKGDRLTLPLDGVLASAGLKKGQPVTQKDIEEAARRLVDTGYLASVNFNYQTRDLKGRQSMALTFEIIEAPRDTEVLLDFPGVTQESILAKLQTAQKFLFATIPGSDAATRYAVKELEEIVGAPVDTMVESDLHTRHNTLVFHLRYTPQIESIEVSGNRTVSNATVLGTISRLGVGQPYSDRRFQRMVELDVRPTYERLGRLEVQFRWLPPIVKDNAVTARFEIDEGQLYRMGNIKMAGEAIEPDQMLLHGGFPKGIANWTEVERSARNTLEPLKALGYLSASARIVRKLRPEVGLVDLTIEVRRAQQFLFGGLRVEGLPEADRQLAQADLHLKAGEPYNDIYLKAYAKDFCTRISNKEKTITQEMNTRQGTNMIDLVWKFK